MEGVFKQFIEGVLQFEKVLKPLIYKNLWYKINLFHWLLKIFKRKKQEFYANFQFYFKYIYHLYCALKEKS